MGVHGLGQTIRALRLQRQMTGTELARRCGVTKGLISQIERGTTVPSLDVLVRVANALEVSVGQLLDSDLATAPPSSNNGRELPHHPVVRRAERRRVAFPRLNQVYELLTPSLSGQIEFGILRVGPLDVESSVSYVHPGEECILVLEGSLSVSLGDQTYRLEVGDSMTYPATVPHSYRCEGDQPAVVVMAETPPAFLRVMAQHTSLVPLKQSTSVDL